MAEERVRVEIGFAGGQIVGSFVERSSADALDAALAGGSGSSPVVVVAQIAYYKRIVRAGRVGFASA